MSTASERFIHAITATAQSTNINNTSSSRSGSPRKGTPIKYNNNNNNNDNSTSTTSKSRDTRDVSTATASVRDDIYNVNIGVQEEVGNMQTPSPHADWRQHTIAKKSTSSDTGKGVKLKKTAILATITYKNGQFGSQRHSPSPSRSTSSTSSTSTSTNASNSNSGGTSSEANEKESDPLKLRNHAHSGPVDVDRLQVSPSLSWRFRRCRRCEGLFLCTDGVLFRTSFSYFMYHVSCEPVHLW